MEEIFEVQPSEGNEPSKAAKKTYNRRLWELLGYVGVFVVTLLLFWTCEPLIELQRKGALAQTLIAMGLLLCVGFVAYMGAIKRLNTRMLVFVLLLAGFIVRVGYMLYTAAPTRQQDTYTKNFDGHEAYAWTIFSTGKLPTVNAYQFYHPPLNAALQAGFMKFMQGITLVVSECFGLEEYFATSFLHAKPDYIEAERYYLYSTCQILCVTYSVITAATLVKIVGLFSFSNKTKILLSAFVIFYPRHVQFAGMLNNDALSYLCAVLALYYALKWQKKGKKWVHVLCVALFVGLGMMAKLSSATICLPIAGIFIYEFIRTLQKKEGSMPLSKMLCQYAVFLCVCAPLGLWFQVYAKMRFDQNFGFVFSNLNGKLSTEKYSFFERFIFTFDLSEWFGSIYCRPFEGNYFLFHYALRSSIFGEFSYWQGEGFAVAAIFTAYVAVALLAASLTWAVVVCIRTRKEEEGVFKRAGLQISDLIFVFLLVQSQVLSEIYFYIQMPYACTMDFRYIMPLILGVALLLGYTQKILAVEGGKCSIELNRLTLISVVAFLSVSTLFYCVCI